MKWPFQKKRKKFSKQVKINPWKEKYEALEKDYNNLRSSHQNDFKKTLKNLENQFAEEKNKLEKELVYWKEKALNFKKFHV